MTDDPKADINAVNDTQQSAMPTDDQKTTGTEVSGEAAQGEETSQTADEPVLPEGVKERTAREFDKLQSQLREERAKREYLETVWSSMKPKEEPKAEVMPPIYDSQTGLLNEQALTDLQRQSLEAQQRAARAESTIQSYMEEKEKLETYSVHPELNPDGKSFNKDLHVATRRILLDSMVNPQDYGKQLSFKEAGDLAKKVSQPAVEAAKAEGAKEALEQLTPKEQAALEATGSPNRRNELSSNIDDLRYKTRKGDKDAIVERLRNIPVAGQE